jgi:hypothetical protein
VPPPLPRSQMQGILRQKIIGFEYTDVIEKELKPLL